MNEIYDRVAARDAAIKVMLPYVPAEGWTVKAMVKAGGAGADLLFPGGPAEMVAAYIDMADREMAASAAAAGQKLSRRVRMLILARLEAAEPHKAAIRRGLAVLAQPGNAGLAARCTAGTVDAIWAAAGDTSADFSWYTKRGILAGVYGSTLLYWLAEGRSREDVEAFLDRRLEGVARLGKLRARLTERFAA
jgi:ubiquinone biosynthesis protein COQ9